MSLRMRLIGLIAIGLVISLAFGGGIAFLNASRSVQNEMHAALQVGRQTVANALADLQRSSTPRRDLENLVRSFKGNRHLRVSLAGDPAAIAVPAVERSHFGKAPRWFVRLIGVGSEADRVPVAIAGRGYGTIVLETDPHNEILEVWNEFNDGRIIFALFCGQTILLIYLFVGRALRPLHRLAAALEQVGHGDYRTRVEGGLTPELSRLYNAFNRMASRLAAMDADNRRLHEQLLILQEEERAELARDLHDEVSPFLFAIRVDTANISRLLAGGQASEAADHLRFISEAVGHLQREVRNMLARLRPAGLAEFGLGEAIGNLVAFWRRRHPEIDYRIAVAPECEGLGEVIDTTIYRVVQECLSNAVRHGRPNAIVVRIEHRAGIPAAGDEIEVEITDDGQGMRDALAFGFGLRGMSERVRAMGGRLTLRNRPGGGLAVTAVMPCRLAPALVAAGPEAGGP